MKLRVVVCSQNAQILSQSAGFKTWVPWRNTFFEMNYLKGVRSIWQCTYDRVHLNSRVFGKLVVNLRRAILILFHPFPNMNPYQQNR